MTRVIPAIFLLAAMSACLNAAPGESTHYHWSNYGLFSSMDIEIRGPIEFTDNDADVKNLANDGYFRLEQWYSGKTRVYIVRPGSNGLERLYSIDGTSKPIDADGRAWLAHILPDVIRESAIGAPERVKRILKAQGASGVLAEVAKIHSDHSRRVYLEDLLDSASLSGEDLRESMRMARKISSDGEKAGLLMTVAPRYQSAGVRESFFDAADSIDSDGEHRRVLDSVLEHYGSDHATLALALHSAKHISSDGEKAEVLEKASDFRLADEASRANFFRAAESIDSDGERRRVLGAVLKQNGADRDILVRGLRCASGISSDGEKAAVLVDAANVYVDDPVVRRAFFDTAGTIDSDGERHNVLSALLKKSNWNADTLREVAKSAAKMSSDGEKAAVLASMAEGPSKDQGVADALVTAADTINSDGEHAKVLMAALNAPLAKDGVILVIRSAEKISSDGEKARVLTRVAERYRNDPQIGSALRSAAKSISSDGEYRRVMTALDHGNSF